jgi:hypothetical protein
MMRFRKIEENRESWPKATAFPTKDQIAAIVTTLTKP